ncbi:MAG: glycosyltransferase family 1 protein [Bacteroidota bacterium]|nr:MAG: glycosyltransferase family 1 protein [Bacteroidota bacterium]
MHFAIISPPVPGHLYPNGYIGLELVSRGHKVTVFNMPDTKNFIEKLGLNFIAVGETLFPAGSWNNKWNIARTGSNLWRDTRILKEHIQLASCMLEELPELIKKLKVDAILADQLQPQASTLAELMNIPFATLCSILPLHGDYSGRIPASFAWWQPKDTAFNRAINRLSHQAVRLLAYGYLRMINNKRKALKLVPLIHLEQTFSTRLQIGVIPEAFDFARPAIKNYFSVGPTTIDRKEEPFSLIFSDEKPIVYVSFGTIRNKIDKLFRLVIKVAKKNPQWNFILTKGNWTGNAIVLEKYPENVLAIEFAPQLEILKKASCFISHAGPGSVLESIYHGVPILALPVSDDQPAVAARIKYHRLGIVHGWRGITANKIEQALSQLIEDKSYRYRCCQMALEFKKSGGASYAADLIEKFFNAEKEASSHK